MRRSPTIFWSAWPTSLVVLAGCAGAPEPDLPTVETWGPLELCLNEFVADNASGWRDETGALSDWIEVHNPTDADVDLEGWWVTDDPDDPYGHRLTGASVPAGGFVVLVADDRPELGPLHLPFLLDASGEGLGLLREDGVGELLWFAEVVEDFAWARSPDCCPDAGSCSEVRWHGTPGQSNAR